MPEESLVVDLVEEEGARGAPSIASTGDVVVVAEDGLPSLPPAARLQDDGSIILPLAHPVTLRFRKAGTDSVREESLAELHLRRLTGADMRAVAAASGGAGIMVTLARSARIGEAKFGAIFDRMDAGDVDDALNCVARFLGSGRRTGR